VHSSSPPGDIPTTVHVAARPGSIIRVPADPNSVSTTSANGSITENTTPPPSVSSSLSSSSTLSSLSSVNTVLSASHQVSASVPVSVPATPIVTPPSALPLVSAAAALNPMLPTINSSGMLIPSAHTHGTHPQAPQRPVPGHSRNSSLDLRVSSSGCAAVASRSSTDIRNMAGRAAVGHSRTASLDLRHTRNSSADLNKLFRNDVGLVFGAHQGRTLA